MTGVEFRAEFEARIDELGSGYWDDFRLNSLIKSALIKIRDPKVELYGETKKITREMQVVINKALAVPVINGTVDISPTSSVVPTFYSEIQVTPTCPYLGRTITKDATVLNLNEGISPFNKGTARYPKYYLVNGVMNIEPVDAVSVDIVYFIATVNIDVANNTDQIPYNDKLIDLLIDMTMKESGVGSRDEYIEVQSTQDVMRNP